MANDPRKLRPASLVRLLNSTPLGEVLSESRMVRHRNRAGSRIGDAKTVDLLRYTAWLRENRKRALAATYASHGEQSRLSQQADRARSSAADRSRRRHAAGSEIGPPPPIADPDRRAAAEFSLAVFCTEYFGGTFYLPWSPDHREVIATLEQVLTAGGLYALAMPRGSGKSSLLRAAVLWAILTGRRRFIIYVSANDGKAEEAAKWFRRAVACNQKLQEDFGPELYAFVELENKAARCASQTCCGNLTHIGWGANGITFATVPGSKASGARIAAYGIESGDLLGSLELSSDGETSIRPDLAVVDDPQTKETARSASQTETRHQIIMADILGLGGPGYEFSAVALVTVKERNDLADRLLDAEKSPQFQGQRFALLKSMPTRMDLWDQYSAIQADAFRRRDRSDPHTEYYREHQVQMDAGAIASWPERHGPRQLSAIQFAMDLFYLDRYAFQADYQNAPEQKGVEVVDRIPTPDEIASRVNGLDRGKISPTATVVTAFIDIQQSSLWWVVVWWEKETFSGGVAQYGVFPEQSRRYFTLRDVAAGKRTLSDRYPGGMNAAWLAGLNELSDLLLSQDFATPGGARHQISRLLIDSSGKANKTVHAFCRQSPHRARITPYHGVYIGPGRKRISAYARRPGEVIGEEWHTVRPSSRDVLPHVNADVNYWKSFVMARLSTPIGDPGSLTVYGTTPVEHRMYADHFAAEKRDRVRKGDEEFELWSLLPSRLDQHLWDGTVGCAVAASMCGCVLAGHKPAAPSARSRRRRTVTYLDI